MKIFGFNITRGEQKTEVFQVPISVTATETATTNGANYEAFTSFLAPAKTGNLSLPYINRNTNQKYIPFGVDNMYPQLMEEMVMMSPLNSHLIKLKSNAVSGGGYKLENYPTAEADKLNIIQFESTNKFKYFLKQITKDLVKHGRITTELLFKVENGQKRLVKINRINPSKIRNNQSCTVFTYIDDLYNKKLEIEIPAYHPTCTAERQLLVYQQDTGENGVYPIPAWCSAADWIFTDGEAAYHHKSNIINSINPSFCLNFPKPANKQAQEQLRQSLNKAKGASGNGKALVFFSNNKDEMPQLIPIQTSNNDKLFLQTSKEAKENIAFAHEIDKAIVGISQAGSLSNIQQLSTAYNFFEKNVILPLREEVQDYMNDILAIKGITAKLVINNFQIVEGVITDQTSNTR